MCPPACLRHASTSVSTTRSGTTEVAILRVGLILPARHPKAFRRCARRRRSFGKHDPRPGVTRSGREPIGIGRRHDFFFTIATAGMARRSSAACGNPPANLLKTRDLVGKTFRRFSLPQEPPSKIVHCGNQGVAIRLCLIAQQLAPPSGSAHGRGLHCRLSRCLVLRHLQHVVQHRLYTRRVLCLQNIV